MENVAAESQDLASLLSQKALLIPQVATIIGGAVRTLWSFPVNYLPIGPLGVAQSITHYSRKPRAEKSSTAVRSLS